MSPTITTNDERRAVIITVHGNEKSYTRSPIRKASIDLTLSDPEMSNSRSIFKHLYIREEWLGDNILC